MVLEYRTVFLAKLLLASPRAFMNSYTMFHDRKEKKEKVEHLTVQHPTDNIFEDLLAMIWER